MHKVNLSEAENCLAELVNEVANGGDVIITQDNGLAFKIIPLPHEKPTPKYGSAKGIFKVADDFDEPLDDFKDYAP